MSETQLTATPHMTTGPRLLDALADALATAPSGTEFLYSCLSELTDELDLDHALVVVEHEGVVQVFNRRRLPITVGWERQMALQRSPGIHTVPERPDDRDLLCDAHRLCTVAFRLGPFSPRREPDPRSGDVPSRDRRHRRRRSGTCRRRDERPGARRREPRGRPHPRDECARWPGPRRTGRSCSKSSCTSPAGFGHPAAADSAASIPTHSSSRSAEMNASCGTSTRPMFFIRFLPSFCFSRSLRFRVMSPP